MMLRQEGGLDRSIDRKVLLRLRKESNNLPTAPAGQDEVSRIENTEEATESDIMSYKSQGVETVEDAKMNERRGNVYENKGPHVKNRKKSGNVTENKGSYATDTGISLKRNGVSGR
ncbi:MAG: hypothetical protein ACLQVM_22475 [Terriglobia bacterium]